MGQHDARIRAAMGRLLRSESIHTDGTLTVANLAREAGFMTRRPIYEAGEKSGDLVEEFRTHIRRLQEQEATPHERYTAKIDDLEEKLRKEKEKSAKYRKERDDAVETRNSLAVAVAVLDAKIQRCEDVSAQGTGITVLRPESDVYS